MVEIFTPKDPQQIESTVQDKVESDEMFELQIKASLQEMTREPSRNTIEYLLNYSQSNRKVD